jgi:peptidoglycan/xylan/chitin deacetylase (PgdA/CDA1 family)
MKTAAVEEVRRRATAAVRAGLYARHATRTVAGKVRPRALVLVYHRVGEPSFDPFGQAVSPAIFASHLRVLRAGYRVESVDGLLRALRERRIEDGTVVVTFDDGYADVMLEAAPIAAEHDVPLHLFVAVGAVLDGERFWWDRLAAGLAGRESEYRSVHAELRALPAEHRAERIEELLGDEEENDDRSLGRPLTPEELSSFSSMPGIGIGAHTLSHPVLGALSTAEQRHELAESRAALHELTGKEIDTFAYPFGKPTDLNGESARIAAEAGYQAAFTTAARPVTSRSDRFLLPRLTGHGWPEAEFRARLAAIFGY